MSRLINAKGIWAQTLKKDTPSAAAVVSFGWASLSRIWISRPRHNLYVVFSAESILWLLQNEHGCCHAENVIPLTCEQMALHEAQILVNVASGRNPITSAWSMFWSTLIWKDDTPPTPKCVPIRKLHCNSRTNTTHSVIGTVCGIIAFP